MKRQFWFGLVIGLGIATLAPALGQSFQYQLYNGSELLEMRSQYPDYGAGYIAGTTDSLGWSLPLADLSHAFQDICMPKELLPREQIRDIIYKYVEDNPRWRHEPVQDLVVLAYMDAFPCPIEPAGQP